MNKYVQRLKNPVTILGICTIVLTIAVISVILKPEASPTAHYEQESPAQTVTSNKEILQKTSISPDEQRTLYKSSHPQRPNEIITNKNETVILFQREVIEQNEETPSINSYKEDLGQPEEIVQGSSFYGQSPITYIYASKGVAFIGSEENKVLEVQRFQPMTVAEYKQKYGGDIVEYHHAEE